MARYTALQERITYATKVLKWWKDITRKANAWNLLDEANATAKELVVDYTLTDDQLKAAVMAAVSAAYASFSAFSS